MKRHIVACLIPVLLILRANAFGASDCDRSCLRSTLDQYLNAVTRHDPNAAPLRLGFRQTENATIVKLGTGLWKTATALGKVQRRYFDTVSGQAAFFGLLEENGTPAIVTLRLRIDNRKISEAEWVISRKGDPGLNGPSVVTSLMSTISSRTRRRRERLPGMRASRVMR